MLLAHTTRGKGNKKKRKDEIRDTRKCALLGRMVVVHVCGDAMPKRPLPYYPDMLQVWIEKQETSLVIKVVEGGDADGNLV